MKKNKENTETIRLNKDIYIYPQLIVIGNYGNGYSSKNVYDSKGLAPTLKAGNNHGTGVAILVREENGNKDKRK